MPGDPFSEQRAKLEQRQAQLSLAQRARLEQRPGNPQSQLVANPLPDRPCVAPEQI